MRLAAALALVILAPGALALLPPSPCPLGDCAIPNAGAEDCPGCTSESGALPTAWVPYVFPGQCAGEGVSWSSAHSHGGAGAIRIEDTASRCTGVVSQSVPIVTGIPYRAGMWAKATEGAPTVGVFIAYYASADADPLQYVVKIPFAGAPGADWTWIGGTTQQVVGATHVRLWAYAPMAAAGTTYVDDFSLEADLPVP